MTKSKTQARAITVKSGKKPKPASRASTLRNGANLTVSQGKRDSKAKDATGAPTPRTKRKAGAATAESAPKAGSKTSQVLELLRRSGGVSSQDLMKATGWLPHSVRGFVSGTVGKKMGLTVISAKADNGGRVYSIEG